MGTEDEHSQGTGADRFVPRERLGRGAAGAVYRATDRLLGTDVALKVLDRHEGMAGDRLLAEAAIGQQLAHEHIVRVHGLVRLGDGSPVIVMEYLPGGSVRDRLLAGPLPTLAEVVAVLLAVARALDHAHRCGVVHRDVKPSNILLGDAGAVKLADFGVAKAAFAGPSVTATGEVVGTARYMAPELLRGGEATPRSDIYALGLVARDLYAGGPEATPRRPAASALPRGTPRWFADVVRRCTEESPADRYGSAAELADALASGRERGRPRLRVAGLVAACVATVALVAMPLSDRWFLFLALNAPPVVRAAEGLADAVAHLSGVTIGGRQALAVALVTAGTVGQLRAAFESGQVTDPRYSLEAARLLCAATRAGRADVLAYLLDRGHGPDIVCRGDPGQPSLLSTALSSSHPTLVSLLLDRGAPVGGQPEEFRPAVHAAARDADDPTLLAFFGHPRLRREPVMEGALTPIVLARQGDRSARLLAVYRASGGAIDAATPAGVTAFYAVVAACEADAAAALAAAGARTGHRVAGGETAAHVACIDPARGEQGQVVRLLAAYEADLNAAASDGATPLMRAVARGDAGLVSALLAQPSVDVDRRDGQGTTALMRAAGSTSDDPDVVTLLLRRGADPHIRNALGMTALDAALVKGNAGAVRLLRRDHRGPAGPPAPTDPGRLTTERTVGTPVAP